MVRRRGWPFSHRPRGSFGWCQAWSRTYCPRESRTRGTRWLQCPPSSRPETRGVNKQLQITRREWTISPTYRGDEKVAFAVLLVFHSKNFRSQKPAKEEDFNLESDSEVLT